MQKVNYLGCFLMAAAVISCNSGKNDSRVKEPEAQVAQVVSSDTVVTLYTSQQPYKLNQQINTQIKFVRSLKDTVGRFYLNEKYLNRKDSVIQHYEGAGNYKILPKPNGDIQGIALYDMVLDDKSKGYVYLLKDSITMVKADDQGNELKGDDAVILKADTK
jgi:acyl-CoA synthetase (AMP-forming)/AMP-acid ligase II